MKAKPAAPAAPDEHSLLDLVCHSAERIWQAGLGAFARAQQEGSDLFDTLAQDGSALHQAAQRLAQQQGVSVVDTIARLAAQAGKPSAPHDKLDQVLQERVARALLELGVPPPQELAALRAEVARLGTALRELEARYQEQAALLAQGLAWLQTPPGPDQPPPRRARKPTAKAGRTGPASGDGA